MGDTHRARRSGLQGGPVTALSTPVAPSQHLLGVSSGVDRAIRLSTTGVVLAVAGIAAYISYWHAYAVVREYGESGATARLEPATIDGLVYASSMVILYAARHRIPVPRLARWMLALGILASLAVNVAQGWSHGLVGAVVAAWPAVSLVGSYELLAWIIRTAATVGPDHVPAADHDRLPLENPGAGPQSATDQRTTVGLSVPDHPDLADRAQGHADQVPGWPPAVGTCDIDADVAAVAAYRASIRDGQPISERKLAAMFGKTSRRWARSRMAEARQGLTPV